MRLKEPLLIAITLFLLGMGLGLKYHWSLVNPRSTLHERLGQMALSFNRLQKQNSALNKEIATLQQALSKKENRVQLSQKLMVQIKNLQQDAGLTTIIGPGVKVLMANPQGQSASAFFIHSNDVLEVLNELKAAGAEAISINGQRVVSTTEVREAGSGFSINNYPTAPPFIIQAVGNPQTMQAALMLRGGIVDTLRLIGIKVQVSLQKNLKIPVFSGAYRFKWAATSTKKG